MPKPPKSNPSAATTSSVPEQVSRAYAKRNELGSQCKWIFEVDYSINSKKSRFFVYDVDTGAFYMYECAHGTVLRNCNKSACSGGSISSRAGRRRWRNDARGTTWPNGSETAI